MRTAELGRQIYQLERDRSTRGQISDEFPDLSSDDAYAVQEEYAKLRMADGAKLVGRKIGLTSRAIQEMFGITDPDYGHIFDDMAIANGGDVATDELIQPMVEIEVAFVLGRDLAGPGVTRDDVVAATEAVAPSIEIIDSRITDWAIHFVDTVADNGSSARYVFGEGRLDPSTIDVPSVIGEMWRNGELVSSAPASAVLDGHPADGVAWLANAIGAYGRTLHAGDVVLSGALMRAMPAEKATRSKHGSPSSASVLPLRLMNDERCAGERSERVQRSAEIGRSHGWLDQGGHGVPHPRVLRRVQRGGCRAHREVLHGRRRALLPARDVRRTVPRQRIHRRAMGRGGREARLDLDDRPNGRATPTPPRRLSSGHTSRLQGHGAAR